jgi:hypothetical protein
MRRETITFEGDSAVNALSDDLLELLTDADSIDTATVTADLQLRNGAGWNTTAISFMDTVETPSALPAGENGAQEPQQAPGCVPRDEIPKRPSTSESGGVLTLHHPGADSDTHLKPSGRDYQVLYLTGQAVHMADYSWVHTRTAEEYAEGYCPEGTMQSGTTNLIDAGLLFEVTGQRRNRKVGVTERGYEYLQKHGEPEYDVPDHPEMLDR